MAREESVMVIVESRNSEEDKMRTQCTTGGSCTPTTIAVTSFRLRHDSQTTVDVLYTSIDSRLRGVEDKRRRCGKSGTLRVLVQIVMATQRG